MARLYVFPVPADVIVGESRIHPLTHGSSRLIQNVPSRAMNRKRRPRSSLVASARKPQTTSSRSTLPSSAVSSMPHS